MRESREEREQRAERRDARREKWHTEHICTRGERHSIQNTVYLKRTHSNDMHTLVYMRIALRPFYPDRKHYI